MPNMRLSFLLPALAVIAGCASGPPPASVPAPAASAPVAASAPAPAPPASAATAAEKKTAAAESLTVERQWLQTWFKGTPVVIGQLPGGAITVTVPREFCFAPGKSDIKPSLAAVLDKTTQSLRRVPLAQVQLIAGPDDAGAAATSTLAVQRATQVREYLRTHGIVVARLGKPSANTAATVLLRIDSGPPPAP